MATQQYVILSRKPSSGNGLAPLGTRREVVDQLGRFNTSPERADVDDVLWGPGVRIDLPPLVDPITQMLLTVVEEEIGWMVIIRLAKHFQWKIVDTATGRELNP